MRLHVQHWVTQADDNLAFFPGFSRKTEWACWVRNARYSLIRVYNGKCLMRFCVKVMVKVWALKGLLLLLETLEMAIKDDQLVPNSSLLSLPL